MEKVTLEFEKHVGIGTLPLAYQALLQKARKATAQAYAPYSNFKVAAAALLADKTIITGTNQENASYPAGICAERTLLSTVQNIHPNNPILAMAISYYYAENKPQKPITPCGICRQSLLEYIGVTKQPVTLILSAQEGEVWVIPNAMHLLPLSFEKDFLI
jgi:cytidine deaminase